MINIMVSEKDIFDLLARTDKPMSTKAVAEELRIDWHTAKKKLEHLVNSKKIFKKKWNNNLTLYWDRQIW
jgi:predicted ArsR family transcriptional regulator